MVKRTILVAVGFACSVVVSGNVVSNSGFEEVNADGSLKGIRNTGNLFRRDPSGGVGGSAALMYENADPKANRILPAMPLPLNPGKAYSISFKVRCENLTGGRASFCLEWDGPDGKWDNGVYGLKHITGTTGWTTMEAVTPRPGKGRRNFRFSPGVSKGSVGKVWFDDIVIKPLSPRPIESIYSDVYRDVAPDGNVRFFAALNAADVSGGIAAAKCAFIFVGANGNPFSRKASVEGDLISVSVPVSDLAEGRHPVEVVLCGSDGVEYRDRLFFTRGDPGKRRVYIDRHRRTIVDGKPFFPLGMYWLNVSDEDLELYSKGPFNCLKTYVRHGKELLDRCERHGIKVLVSAGVYAKRGNVKSVEEEYSFVTNVVSYAKNHPATLAYYVNDENPLSWREDLTRRQELLSELDPGHPTFSVICQTESMAGYLPTADVFGSDPYPAPGDTMWLPMKWMRQKNKGASGTRAIWQVTQAFDKGAYHPANSAAAKASKMPSEQEIRCMIWQNIASGANGILLYSFFDLKKMDWKTPFKDTWATVCRLGSEVKRHENVFLTDEDAPRIKVLGTIPEWLAYRAWRFKGETYLLAVNGTQKNMHVEIEVASGFTRSVTELGCDAKISRKGRILFDLPALGVSFQRLVK